MINNLSWQDAIQKLESLNETYVLCTVLGVRGSAPRDSATKMVVSRDVVFSTIGGGNLEYKSTLIARDLINGKTQDQHLEHFPLGASLGQCCGGSVSVLFEKFVPIKINLMLFGAGHVGHALVKVLADLPCNIKWVDSRENYFPDNCATNIETIVSEFPHEEVTEMPSGSYFVVMTHNHQIDLEICSHVLNKPNFEYLGLIGSLSKSKRFKAKLKQRLEGNVDSLLDKLVCPIGLSDVEGKLPMEVAVSIAGQIIQTYQQNKLPKSEGVIWPELSALSEKLLVQE